MEQAMIGEFLGAYSDATDIANIGLGKTIRLIDTQFGERIFKFLKNTGATTITSTIASNAPTGSHCVRATQLLNNEVQVDTTAFAVNFGGLRLPMMRGGILVAPDDVPQNSAAWFMIGGYGWGRLGAAASATVAGALIGLHSTAGAVQGVNSGTVAEVASAFAFAVQASGGVTGEVVPMRIFRSAWGEN